MANADTLGAYDHWSMVVVYDTDSGDILHTHQCVTSRGGTHPDERTLEAEALRYAGERQRTAVSRLSVLHVDPRDLKIDAHYSVDIDRRVMIEKELNSTADNA